MKTNSYLGLSEEGFHHIAYTEWGSADKGPLPPVLCVHGLTRNGRDFDWLARHLSGLNRHVFCPDIVGRGNSDRLRDPLHYTYEQYIADMTTLIARIGSSKVDFIGTSMGGLIGMVIASMPKSPIRRLILNDIGPQISAKALARLAKYVGRDPDFASVEEAKHYFKTIYADFGPLQDSDWQTLTENSIQEIAPGKYVSKLDHGVKRSQTRSKLAWKSLLNPHKALEGTLFDLDLWQIWRKVSCPVLVIHGTRSDVLVSSTIEKMQRIHPNVEVLEVADSGHAPALIDVKQQDVIYQWLKKT